jgi:hypothetical protein
MKIPGLRGWIKLVVCYWLVMIIVVALEIVYMRMTWAGLPGFVLSLPLSVFVATGYIGALAVRDLYGYEINVTEYHIEYAFLVCAFLNAFIFYPFYWWWIARRQSKRERQLQQPPPPPSMNL